MGGKERCGERTDGQSGVEGRKEGGGTGTRRGGGGGGDKGANTLTTKRL